MASTFKILIACLFVIASSVYATDKEEETKEFVITLDHSNLTEAIAKHPFILVEFYAPWCGHCKHLAPEYEKAASVLSSHDPPIVLAKYDANEEANKELAKKYEIRGFPTLTIFRNGEENVQEYKGPREADGIVKYLKKQVGPASVEIKSIEESSNHITGNNIFVTSSLSNSIYDHCGIFLILFFSDFIAYLFQVGLFPDFSGEEYQNFTILAENLRSDFDFGHNKDAKLFPRGDAVNGPIIRLFKPFDELLVDFQDFHVEALEKFIREASVPLVTQFNKDPNNQQYVAKFFNTPNDKVIFLPRVTLYSFGVIFLEILFGRQAIEHFHPLADQNLVRWIKSHSNLKPKFVDVLDSCTKSQLKSGQKVVKLALECASAEVEFRPTMDEVVKALAKLQN